MNDSTNRGEAPDAAAEGNGAANARPEPQPTDRAEETARIDRPEQRPATESPDAAQGRPAEQDRQSHQGEPSAGPRVTGDGPHHTGAHVRPDQTLVDRPAPAHGEAQHGSPGRPPGGPAYHGQGGAPQHTPGYGPPTHTPVGGPPPTDPVGWFHHSGNVPPGGTGLPPSGESAGSPGYPPPGAGPVAQPAQPRSRRRQTILLVGATALVTSLIVGPTAAYVTTELSGDGAVSSLDQQPGGGGAPAGDVSEVADSVLPSVVSIFAGESGGSGVIISSDGQIMTNNHVVANARDGEITVQFNDGSTATARVLGTDPTSDLAVIQADGVSELTPARLGDSSQLQVGDEVVAIGSPLGLSGTVTTGIVSAVNRPVNTTASQQEQQQPEDFPFDLPQQDEEPQTITPTVIDAIQTDAPINPGNSGGALVNMSGEVIGINSVIMSGAQAGSIGLGFAIPVNAARPIAEQLIDTGTATYTVLGVSINDAIGENGLGEGAQVAQVQSGGPADGGGLREGDVITQVNDRRVANGDDLIAAVRSHRPDDTVTITYQRGGHERTAEVTLAGETVPS
ncbi:S1C family serine protease [Allonocardiopsis opalescens]|uniref:Putative serine protease PepD n=1 Tax=Allonocardiopsis opalescens TaxID=1144618 RepID=A0A2T0Q0N1_9ACTN|nr:trypsin-like peptidase domain-containing protein [Allonocardiopsis opalescens]PRX97233.1 putative serine protease PepD [Allonocardiopsis opalescens]